MAAEQIEPDVDEDLDDDSTDRAFGGLTASDRLEVERWSNEAFAELVSAANDGYERRPGAAWRSAWSRAGRALPDEYGDEDAPVFVHTPSWADDALRAIFSGGPAPATRAESSGGPPLVPQAEGAKAPRGPASRRRNPATDDVPASRSPARWAERPGTAAEGVPARIVPTPSHPTERPPAPTETTMPSSDLSDRAVAHLREHGPLPTRDIAEALKADAHATRLALMMAARSGRAECSGLARAARWSATSINGAAAPTARSAKVERPRAARKPSARAQAPRKASGPKVGMPWGISDSFEIPAAPCSSGEHGAGVDALLQKRCDLIQALAGKVSAIDGAIRALIE